MGHPDITRRSLALAGIGAAVGIAVPSKATAASSELRQLWQLRTALHSTQEDALNAVMGSAYDGPEDGAAARAIEVLWRHDDKIMSAPVSSVDDLAIKAKVIEVRLPDSADGSDILIPYVEQLVADVATLAVAARSSSEDRY